MSESRLQQLAEFGQSVWLDYISRPLLETGQLKEWIDSGLRGMTSNPSIFNKAIGSTGDYDEKIIALKNSGKSAIEIYDELTIKDIQDACDQFKPVFDATERLDGYVSLEINPLLANKVEEQAKEGLRLFKAVGRENCMIKVPATEEGFPVLEELIANGVNVNNTLIFSLKQYERSVEAYFKGLRRFEAGGGDLSIVRSVASIFVSRIDTLVDKLLDEKAEQSQDKNFQEAVRALRGKTAVANSRIIYEKFKELYAGDEFAELFNKKANVQRVLWGSTSTKNPDYSDIKYVEELITKQTVNTIPENTLKAFVDHGTVKEAFDDDPTVSFEVINSLRDHEIQIEEVCQKLLDDGCQAFNDSFETLIKTIEEKTAQLVSKT